MNTIRIKTFLGVAAFGIALTSGTLHAQTNGPFAQPAGNTLEASAPVVRTGTGSLLDGVRADRGLSAFLTLVEAATVTRVGGRIVIGGQAWIVGESIQTENGVIHVISRVLES